MRQLAVLLRIQIIYVLLILAVLSSACASQPVAWLGLLT